VTDRAAVIRVLVADDHAPTRRLLREELEAAGLVVCAEAATGDEAVEAATRERPDLCLLDVQMPAGDGIAATRAIRAILPAAKVLLITVEPSEEGLLAAVRAGADGYLAKDIDPLRLPHVVRAVAEGETAFSRRLLGAALRVLRQVA
jgi:two-component system nitrate/nitrite response regulator NarL